MVNIERLKETRKLYSSQLRKVQRPDRIKVILSSIDNDIKREKETVVA